MPKKKQLNGKILKHLDKNGVVYDLLDHKTVYTAYDLAQTLKEDLGKIGKTLLIKKDKDKVIVVLPASHQLDVNKLKKKLKATKITIEPEKVIAQVIKGASKTLTPFGELYQALPVIIDKALTKVHKVILSAGDFEQSVHLKTKDLLKVTDAEVQDIGKKAKRTVKKAPAKANKVVKKLVKKVPIKAKKAVKKAVKKASKKTAQKSKTKKKIVSKSIKKTAGRKK